MGKTQRSKLVRAKKFRGNEKFYRTVVQSESIDSGVAQLGNQAWQFRLKLKFLKAVRMF